MIRLCPNCDTERPLSEFYCEGTREGATCGWDLSGVEIREQGSKVLPTTTPPPELADRICPNGHVVTVGDLICPVCEAVVAPSSDVPFQVPRHDQPTVVEGWQLNSRLPPSSPLRERYIAVRVTDGRQAVLTLYAGSEPDPAVYDAVRRLPRDHVPEIIETGRWQDRAYEVTEELAGGNLSTLPISNVDALRPVVEQLGRALNAFSECGLRHRDLRPSVILVRCSEPLDLAITGFGSARLSEFDLDIVSPLENSRYMAPEAIAGGIAAASDWWSLGMLLLEQLTGGQCFEGVNEQAFLIHVLTNGAPIPVGLDPSIDTLLRGLLARDRRERWQWNEVRRWLAGEPLEAPPRTSQDRDRESGPSLSLAGKPYRTASTFALAAAEPSNWDEARDALLRGAVASWVQEAGFEATMQSGLRQVARALELSEDLRLSMGLKVLNPAMPLIVRGNILTPGWLLDHPEEGYALITGPAPDFLRRLDAEEWLSRLKTRAEGVRARARQLDIELNEEELRVHLLSTSMPRLTTMWEQRRRFLPDSDHPGIASLIDRRQTSEEELILLLGAASGQFRSIAEVVEDAKKDAERAGIAVFDLEQAKNQLSVSRREIYRSVDERIENFARCGIKEVDEWADQFRLDRRMTLPRALALLSVPKAAWQPLPRQSYVSILLGYFSKKITGGVLRGPLARMTVGKSAARVDLTELDTRLMPAAEILAQLLGRTANNINIDPAVFAEGPLERRLRSLHSHSLLYRRDTGIDGLYLGFPFLLMRDPRTTIKTRIAPVLLWPMRINPEVGNRGHITLGFGRAHDGERDPDQVILNPAFEGLMGIEGAARWQDAANELLTRATISIADAVDAFGTLAVPRGTKLGPLPGKDVEVKPLHPELAPSAVLFHLAFMGQAVVKDLDHLKQRSPEGTGLETALRLGELAPTQQVVVRPKEAEKYFTADSDPSQEQAVMEARSAPGLVIEGPPGTGKSQTIVNMVADSIGRAKSLLIICQKQAALEVVRKRLERQNLGERIVLLTDINRDREPVVRAVREQVQALNMRPRGGVPTWRRERDQLASRIEALEGGLDRHHAALHRADDRIGLTYRTLLGELIALNESSPRPLSLPGLRARLLDYHPSEVASIEESCAPLAKFWLASKYEESPLSVLNSFSPDQGTLDLFVTTFKDFVEAEAFRSAVNAETNDAYPIDDPVPLRTWLAEHQAEFASLTPQLCANLSHWLPLFRPPHSMTHGASILEDLHGAQAGLVALDASLHGLPVSAKLRELQDAEYAAAAALAHSATKPVNGLRRVSPGRWFARRKFRKLLSTLELQSDDTAMGNFAAATRLETTLRPLRTKVGNATKTLFAKVADRDLPPARLAALAKDIHNLLARVQQLVEAIDKCPEASALEIAAQAGNPDSIAQFLNRVLRSLRRYDARIDSIAALESVAPYFQADWISARNAAIESERANTDALGAIVDAIPTLAPYQEFRIRSSRLGRSEFDIFKVLRAKQADLANLSTEDLDSCIRRTIACEARLGWKLRIETDSPELLLDSDSIRTKVDALARADEAMRACNRNLLTDGLDSSSIGSQQEWDNITRLRGPRALRLREFIDKAGSLGLMSLRPVWLMTPDVASRVLLPKEGMFHTVIYDEASQMPVEYALPTLFRSKVVVVSGDDKQMPPTSFFSSKVESDEAAIFDGEEPEDDAPEEERDVYIETWNRREIKDCPDLLHLARVVLPTKTLQIHYRSAYRELIAFSNASFYGNRLSVPVRHPDDVVRRVKPIEVVRSNGIYRSQSNIKEAADVVRYLSELWKDPSPPSIGVVTFNRKQADIIEEAIEDRAERDTHFRDVLMRERERIEDGEDMGFFVKNVENVQGDERDVVMFSTTFGRNDQGTFRRNFGVLGQTGGERRLNVAVTRARKKVVLVTSMPVELISEMHSHRRPPATPRDYLQAYMYYAHAVSDGAAENSRALLSRIAVKGAPEHSAGMYERDGFNNSVEEFLRDQGWRPAPADDGGAFGLDFAIENPRTGLYAIGIECDAPRHRILETARAREVWRPGVLRHAVPHVHRVSSYAWMHNGDAERDRLKDAVAQALSFNGRAQ